MKYLTAQNALYVLSNAFRIYVVYRFTNVFYRNKQCRWYTELISYFLLFLVNTVLYFWFGSPIINLLSGLLPLIVITFFYSRKVIYNIGISGAIMLISILCDCLMMPLMPYSPVVETGTATALMSF